MPAMRLQFLREKLNLATEDDDIFVHNLNNDLLRSSNHLGLARNFCDVLSKFRAIKKKFKKCHYFYYLDLQKKNIQQQIKLKNGTIPLSLR